MATFSDFAFYQSRGGKLSEDEYKSVVDDAHAEILSQTKGAAQNAPEVMLEPVILCKGSRANQFKNCDYSAGAGGC